MTHFGFWFPMRARNYQFAVMAFIAGTVCYLLVPQPSFAQNAGSVKGYKIKVEKVFYDWLLSLWPEAKALGVSVSTFELAFKGVKLDWSLPELVPPVVQGYKKVPPGIIRKEKKKKRQPEFDVPARYFPQGYLSNLASQGRRKIKRYERELSAIENKHGVPKEIIIAIWGRETSFGQAKLRHYAIRALATEGFMGLRKDFFRKELLKALKILEERHVTRRRMVSSWAGAMGHTQFLPSDFEKYAIDFNGDGKRDIWSTIPDALASTGYYLSKVGWKTGQSWGYEVKLPKKFDCTLTGPTNRQPILFWTKLGLKRSYNRSFSPEQLSYPASLMIPAGTRGPAFLVTKNFYVIKEYNFADLYALFVGHVADRIALGRPFETKWGRVDSFTRDEIRFMQKKLTDMKLYDDKLDGFVGSKTRVSIGLYEKQAGLPLTCYPTRKMLRLLKAKPN